MAVSLLSHEVSDLCIGKPQLKKLRTSTTVAEAISVLKSSSSSADNYIGITNNNNNKKKAATIVGKICMVDVLCYLCSTENIFSPVAALEKPVSVLLPKNPAMGGIRIMDSNSSISEAIDAILDGGNGSVIVRIPTRRKEVAYCWLTQEDLLRFFLNSIFLFSTVASRSVTSLGLVRPAVLSVRCCEPAVSALGLVRSALDDRTAVAVVTEDGRLVGEISPSTLSACDETVAAAIAALSAGELMAYIDCCSGAGVLSESVAEAVRSRLREKDMHGMIKLLEEEDETLSSSLSMSLSASSSSSDDESEGTVSKRRKPGRTKSGSYSSRMGRRAEEAIVCHPESSVVAVMVQALAHRVSYVWVVEDEDDDDDDDDYGLVGVVTFQDLLRVFREQVPKA